MFRIRKVSFPTSLFILPGKLSTGEDEEKWLPAWIHMIDAEGVICKLLDEWLPASAVKAMAGSLTHDELKHMARLVALTHDISKFSVLFASRISQRSRQLREKVELVGFALTNPAELGTSQTPPGHALMAEIILLNFGCPEGVAAVVGAHHGKPQDLVRVSDPKSQLLNNERFYYGSDPDARPLWKKAQREWFEFALDRAGYHSVEDIPRITMPIQVLLSGLLIMADWIASNTEFFPLLTMDDNGKDTNLGARLELGWKRLDFPHRWQPDCLHVDEDGFCIRYGFRPNAMQHMVWEVAGQEEKPGLMILEAQMGGGKTEAALEAAVVLASRAGSGGIFFGLPTQATADGIFPRLERWAGGQSEHEQHAIRLLHGASEFNEDYKKLMLGDTCIIDDEGGLMVHDWFEGRKQSLLPEFVVGTVDQLLMAALKQNHVALRHLGLAGKVVIVDECHAYDAYMSVYLDRALFWLGRYGVPVILLSATLPQKRRHEMTAAYLGKIHADRMEGWEADQEYPLLTWTEGRSVRQKSIPVDIPDREVKMDRIEDEEVADRLKEVLADGGCAGIIVNTVKRAQQMEKRLKELLPQMEIVIHHSRYTAPDRTEREKELMRRLGKHSVPAERDGLIVIGMQVLEQSLDIDLDYILTDLCPMDLLLQRIGRLHRHDRQRPPLLADARCSVLCAGEELEQGACRIYGKWLLTRTRERLPEKIVLPGDISPLVQAVYREPSDDLLKQGENGRLWRECCARKDMKQQTAEVFCVAAPPAERKVGKPRNMSGWLSTDVGGGEGRARAAVRDGDTPLEVLVMVLYGDPKEREDRKVGFLPWQQEGAEVAWDRTPSEEEAEKIARQRLKLPAFLYTFSWTDSREEMKTAIDRECAIISSILKSNQENIPEWGQSRWLKDEMILLLDKNLETQLGNYRLHYSRETGLEMERIKAEKGDKKKFERAES
ncbi:MAG: CRISPR-associated helicase Cas3' [Clostridiales bacterium]|nr:CRISPR-associated helicase Cas3' [Clostridiales bacterium]